MAVERRNTIQRELVLQAVRDYDCGVDHNFGCCVAYAYARAVRVVYAPPRPRRKEEFGALGVSLYAGTAFQRI